VPRRWVVNASPLIILGKIGQLSLLPQLAEALVIPTAVASEVEAGRADDPAQQWLKVQASRMSNLVLLRR
jgi:predicted nucleic acid-binding protein